MTRDTEMEAFDAAHASAAYVLNALPAEELAAFEAQLGESEETRNEVTAMTETAALLGLAVEPVVPSANLKANIMGMLSSIPQLPPLTSEKSDADTTTSELAATPTPVAPVTSLPRTATLPEEADFGGEFDEPRSSGRAAKAAHDRWFTRPMTMLAAAAAAVALVIGGGVVANVVGNASYQQAQADKLALINAASDVQRATEQVESGGRATLVWSGELGLSALIVDGLDELPAGKTYQLWYIRADGIIPAGTFDVSDDGTTWRVLDGAMAAGDTVGVTIEPRGGSDEPTTAPITAITSA